MNLDLINFKIKESKKILILPSQPADLDCICSALVMKWYVMQVKNSYNSIEENEDGYIGVDEENWVRIYSFFQIPDKLKLFPEISQIEQKYLENVDIPMYDLIIGVDGNGYDRFLTNGYQKYFSQNDLKHKFIVFDHHQLESNVDFLDEYYVSEPEASSTTLVLYKNLFKNLEITPRIATFLYTGISSDTGNFKWNLNSETLKIAGELLHKGADYLEATNVKIPVKEIDFTVWAIQHTKYFPEIKTTLLSINKSHYDELDEIFGDKWDFKDLDRHYKNTFCKLVEGYDYYFILKEDKKNNNVRVAWRVRDLPEKEIDFIHLIQNLGYEAGGHQNSGGARAFNVYIDDVWNKIKNQITIEMS